MLGNNPSILWLQQQLGALSPLTTHHLWVSLPLCPSFGLSPTSPICQVLVYISLVVITALFPHLSSNVFSELIWPICCAIFRIPLTFFFLLDARMGGVSLLLVRLVERYHRQNPYDKWSQRWFTYTLPLLLTCFASYK